MKRKKYTEDLDIKITDDEDEQEDVDVITTSAAVASISGGTAAQLKQELELDVDGHPSMQFFVVRVFLIFSYRSLICWAGSEKRINLFKFVCLIRLSQTDM